MAILIAQKTKPQQPFWLQHARLVGSDVIVAEQ
jgi:hypothetical protein